MTDTIDTATNVASTTPADAAKPKTGPKATPPEVTAGSVKFSELLASHWDGLVISSDGSTVDRDKTERAFSLALTAYLKGKGLITRGGREKSYDEGNVVNAIMVAFLTQAKAPTDQLQLATITYAAIEAMKVPYADMDKARRAVQATLITEASPFYAKRAGESKFSGTVVGLKDPSKLPTAKPVVQTWEEMHREDASAATAPAVAAAPATSTPAAASAAEKGTEKGKGKDKGNGKK